MTNTDSWQRVTCPRGVGLGRGYTTGMGMPGKAEARDDRDGRRATGMLTTGAHRSEPGSINPMIEVARGGDGTVVSHRPHVSAHVRGYDLGPRPPATVSDRSQAGGIDRRSCRVYDRVSRTVASSPEELGQLLARTPVGSPSLWSAYQHLERRQLLSVGVATRDLSGLQPATETSVCHLRHTLSLQQEP